MSEAKSNRRQTVVLCFDVPLSHRAPLRRAAALRVERVLAEGFIPAIVCPEPLAIAGELAQAGIRAVTVPNRPPDDRLIADLIAAETVPVFDGQGELAISLAWTLRAHNVVVYSANADVMSADPQRVAGATRLSYVSHVELLELAGIQSRHVDLQTAEAAHRQGVSYEIRSLDGDSATLVRGESYDDRIRPITSIGVSDGFSFVSLRPQEGSEDRWVEARAALLERLAENGIALEMLQFHSRRLRFVVREAAAARSRALIEGLDVGMRCVARCSKICIVGTGLSTTAGIFYRTLIGLSERRIPVLHFGDSNVTMSIVVPEDRGAEAEAFLHEVLTSSRRSSATMSFDLARGRVRVKGKEIRLGYRQAKLLEFLIENAGRIVEAERAAAYVFGSDGREEVAALRVHMHNLRKKLEDDPEDPRHIVTVPAQGYLFLR
ncbi:MAG TPA: winged helix-turn-helix domain-containing protein [Candidatus Acidoferrales bacterium]|nr:winged helix-turn-helix domain-containing protein [Candidatus Acidoferrales bacterium]